MRTLAEQVVAYMMKNDAFSRWMGIEVLSVEEGACKLKASVTGTMLNGFYIAHGGIAYSLADSALAFASNTYGIQAVSIETSISHFAPVKQKDELTAVASEVKKSNKIGWYRVEVSNQNDDTVALLNGTVYRTGKKWNLA